MQKELYDVVVVGAGIVGCSMSYHLAKAGLDSTTAISPRTAVAGGEQRTRARTLASRGCSGSAVVSV